MGHIKLEGLVQAGASSSPDSAFVSLSMSLHPEHGLQTNPQKVLQGAMDGTAPIAVPPSQGAHYHWRGAAGHLTAGGGRSCSLHLRRWLPGTPWSVLRAQRESLSPLIKQASLAWTAAVIAGVLWESCSCAHMVCKF